MIIAAIDPGLTGAIAFLDEKHGLIAVKDLPTMPTDGGVIRREINVVAFRYLILRWVPADASVLFVMEHASPFGKSAMSSASLEATKAALMAVIRMGGYDVKKVRPQEWKKMYLLGSDKNEAIELARSMFGTTGFERKKDHNRAEAALIAHYGLKTYA